MVARGVEHKLPEGNRNGGVPEKGNLWGRGEEVNRGGLRKKGTWGKPKTQKGKTAARRTFYGETKNMVKGARRKK